MGKSKTEMVEEIIRNMETLKNTFPQIFADVEDKYDNVTGLPPGPNKNEGIIGLSDVLFENIRKIVSKDPFSKDALTFMYKLADYKSASHDKKISKINSIFKNINDLTKLLESLVKVNSSNAPEEKVETTASNEPMQQSQKPISERKNKKNNFYSKILLKKNELANSLSGITEADAKFEVERNKKYWNLNGNDRKQGKKNYNQARKEQLLELEHQITGYRVKKMPRDFNKPLFLVGCQEIVIPKRLVDQRMVVSASIIR